MSWTWGEFKKMVENSGVKDDAPIDYIDVSGMDPLKWVEVEKNNLGETVIS